MKKIYFVLFICLLFTGNIFSQNPPQITVQPGSMVKCVGSSATLTVSVSGTPPFQYQWKKNGSVMTGQTSSTLNFISLALGDEAGYVCVVANGYGTATTDTAFIKVVSNAPTFTSQPAGHTICEGDSVYFSITASGLYMGYQWQFDGSNITNAFGPFYSISSVISSQSGAYTCVVTNACGSVTSNAATLIVNVPPQITTQPENQVICLTEDANFVVVASGTNLNYQWKKEGINISGANTDTYTITNVSVSNEAVYSCVIWNNCDTVTTIDVALSTIVLPDITAQPTAFSQCLGDTITFITTANGTPPITFQWYLNGTAITDATNHTLTINGITESLGGSYYCAITNPCGTIYTDSAALNVKLPPSIIMQPDDKIRCVGDSVSFSVKISGQEPFTYEWSLQGIPIPNSNSSTFVIDTLDQGDAGNYTCMITNECGSILSDTAILTVNIPPLIVLQPVSSTECESDLLVLTCQVQGSEILTYYWTHNGNVLPGSGHNHYTVNPITPESAGDYICYVSNICGADTSAVITISVNTLPHITLQPQDQVACLGGSASFIVSATSTLPLTYHWMRNDTMIDGTEAVYSINNLTLFNAGNYSCQIFNACGDTVTESATLTVNNVPVMNTTLYDKTRCEGDTVSLQVNATGNLLTYQWMHNGSAIGGETSALLDFSSVALSDSGDYYCVVNNNCGADSTNEMTLNVHPFPYVYLGGDVYLCNGDTVILDAGHFMYYVWNNGMHTQTLMVDTSGLFILEAFNEYSCASSDTVLVTVSEVLQVSLGNDTAVCGGITLNAGVAAATYDWNDGQGSGQTFTVTQSGTYYVIVTANGGCESGDTVNVSVYPVPVVNLGDDTIIDTHDTLILTAPPGYASYLWSDYSYAQTLTVYGSDYADNPGIHAFAVTVTNTDGCSASDAVSVNILLSGVDNLNSENYLKLYPNPGNGLTCLEIKNENREDLLFEIVDLNGKIIYQKNFDKNKTEIKETINLTSLSKGVYFVKVKNNENCFVRKLIIQ
ncbi:MAG: immunoglobulin domain-containing protein [Bacteroidia bacterium]|nr:immunoglobulin domain-containing protein [Bacteroidia bacterium]